MIFRVTNSLAVAAALFTGSAPILSAQSGPTYTEETSSRLVGDILNTTYNLFNLGDDEMDQVMSDFDGNGTMDIAICLKANGYTPGARFNILLLNFGGSYFDVTRTRAPDFLTNFGSSRDICAIDIDGDGDDDLIVGNTDMEQPQLYRNNGNANFVEIFNWFTTEQGTNSYNPGLSICNIACGDIDGDGDEDVILGTYLNGSPHIDTRVLINNGTGRFLDQTTARLSDSSGTHWFANANVTGTTLDDMNGDGSLDLIVTENLTGGTSVVYNDGLGFFNCQQGVPAPGIPYMHDTADTNNDGRVDVYIVTDQGDGTTYNVGNMLNGSCLQARFVGAFDVTSTKTDSVGGNVKSYDMDSDGYADFGVTDLDVVTAAGCSGLGLALLQNQQLIIGRPLFADFDPVCHPWNVEATWDFDAPDIDGDGKLDLVVTSCSGIRIFIQD